MYYFRKYYVYVYMHIYVYLYICEEDLVDVGCNADICVANQEQSTDSIHEDEDEVHDKCMWGMLCSLF